MTRAEIFKRGYGKFPQDIIEIINDDGSITREDVNFKLRKAYMEGLIDNNCQLPSDIDEAAEKNFETMEVLEHENIFEETHNKIFKAGAEWNDRQYHKIEGKLVDWYETKDIDYCCGIRTEDSFEVPAGFYIKKKI